MLPSRWGNPNDNNPAGQLEVGQNSLLGGNVNYCKLHELFNWWLLIEHLLSVNLMTEEEVIKWWSWLKDEAPHWCIVSSVNLPSSFQRIFFGFWRASSLKDLLHTYGWFIIYGIFDPLFVENFVIHPISPKSQICPNLPKSMGWAFRPNKTPFQASLVKQGVKRESWETWMYNFRYNGCLWIPVTK